jgi:hypothetical protein
MGALAGLKVQELAFSLPDAATTGTPLETRFVI